jgi:hypothetical protein
MIEARDNEIDEHVRLAKETMGEACRAMLGEPREDRPAVVQQLTAAEIREAKIQAFFARFAADVYDRSKAFDAPLVDIEADRHAGEGKLNGTAGGNEPHGTEKDIPSPAARRSVLDSRDED